jgi:hypothetical protein
MAVLGRASLANTPSQRVRHRALQVLDLPLLQVRTHFPSGRAAREGTNVQLRFNGSQEVMILSLVIELTSFVL